MSKIFSSIILVGIVAFSIAGCSSKKAVTPQGALQQDQANFQCKQESVLAPRWTCIPIVEGYYAGVGVAEKSAAGMGFMRRVALANARSNLAQQIQTQVKDKMELFTRATGNGNSETVDKVSTAVTKQVAKVDLKGSKAIDMWNAPSGAIYMLVTVSQSNVNKEVKKAVTQASSSFKDDNALWQQFQSKQALENLEKEFPTK